MYKPITDIAIYAPLLAANGNKQVYTDGATLVGLTDANGDPVLDGNGAQLTQWMYPVTDKCERSAVVMGDDYVRLSFDLATRVQFAAFSFIEYNGQTFFLRETYRPKNNGTYRDRNGVVSSTYTYDMRFVSLGNMLTKHTCLRNVVVVNETWNEPEININGTLDTLYTMIIGSIEQAALRIRNERQYYRQCLLSLVANKANARLTPNTDLVTFSFSGAKIADCLTTIANGYDETEWFITEDNGSFTLNIAKHEDGENVAILHLSDEKYENTGADKDVHPTLSGGLTSCEYAQEWNGIVQRITPFGSDRNMVKQTGVDSNTDMMVSYGKRLRLDPNHKVRWQSGMTYEAWVQASTSGATFGSLYPTRAMKIRGVTGCYVVKDKQGNAVLLEVDKDGAVTNPDTNVDTGIEEVVMYDEVYPQCHFKITSVEEKTKRIDGELQPRYTIEGVAVDENKYPKSVLANLGMFPIRIIEAETLSVVFESGLLNGREFEITNKTTKDEGVTEYSLRFSIVADGDITEGTLIPSGNFKPNVNDQFALFNMKMPDEFIDMARDELAQKAYDDLIELENTRPEVKCVADEDIFEQYDIYLGRRCEVTSEIFVSDAHFISRVISYSYPLSAPSRVSFSLASAIMEGTISSIESSIGEQTGQIGGLNQRTVNLSRRGWHDASEMAEMLDGITTPMMLVGVEKNQFQYTSSVQCVNGRMNGGVEHFDHLTIGNGVLQHTQKDWIDWHDGRWYIEPVDDLHLCNDSGDSINSVANQEKPFYLYAFCQEDSEYAQMKLYDMDYTSEHHIEEDVHYLLLGILSSEFVDGGTAYRVFNRSNGYTQIAGGTITTEQIQDPTRSLIIDLASNPPRIIAKGGAEIIGNIRFISSGGQKQTIDDYIDDALDGYEIGGENLYTKADPLGVSTMRRDTGITLENGKKYVISIGTITGDAASLFAEEKKRSIYTNIGYFVNRASGAGTTVTYTNKVLVVTGSGGTLFLRGGTTGLGQGWTLTNIMVQVGTKATSYKNSYKYLSDAFSHDATKQTTDIDGGLLATSLVLLRNQSKQVRAGISGLDDDGKKIENGALVADANSHGVGFFAGGTYADALAAAAGNGDIPVLLTKDGILSRIGCFRVVDKDEVRVTTSTSTIIITNKSISEVATVEDTKRDYIEGGVRASGGDQPSGSLQYIGTTQTFNVSGGKYHIDVPATTFTAETHAQSVTDPRTGDGVAIEADVRSFSAQIVIENNGVRKYTSSIVDFSNDDLDAFTDNGDNDTVNKDKSRSLPAVSVDLELEAGTVKIGYYGSYNLYTEDDGFNTDNSQAKVNGGNYVTVTNIDKYAVIAKDGIGVIANSNSTFYVKNDSGNTLQVIAKGLPTSSTGLSSGQLYQDGDYLKIV